MMKLNSKGFTLVEVLAVIVIIGVLSGIAISNVLSSINTSKNSGEKILIDNIKTAAQALYEEVEFLGISSGLTDKNKDGDDKSISLGDDGELIVSLQALVDNGFLKVSDDDNNHKLINPKNKKEIGECMIQITKVISQDDVSYDVKQDSNSNNDNCPEYDGS